MTIIKKFVAGISAIALSVGFALPAAALSVDVSSETSVSGGGNASSNEGEVNATGGANAGLKAGIDAGATAETESDANVNGNSSAALNADDSTSIIITADKVLSGSIQTGINSAASVKSRADLSSYVATQIKNDSNISRVETSPNSVAVSYKQKAKLFGFLPITVNAKAVADANGNVTVRYPWYAFLASTNRAELEGKLESRVSSVIGARASADNAPDASANADVSAEAEAATEFTAETQARIMEEIRAVMASELAASAEANANAEAGANIQ